MNPYPLTGQENAPPKARPRPGGPQPSLPAILFLLWALLIPLFEAEIMINADGDPARHLRHGETILSTGDVIRHDTFSFTRPGASFVGFEYGAQLLLTIAHRLGGVAGMVVLVSLVIAGTLGGLTAWLLRRGLDPLLTTVTVTLTAMLTNIHWLARPHVFSWPLMLLLLSLLERERRPPLWVFGLLFAAWANLHGAFVFGWLMIGIYLTGHLLESSSCYSDTERSRERHKALELVPVLAVSLLTTLLNPYGWLLPWHVVEFFRDPWLRTLTQEFNSPNFQSADLWLFLAALLATMLLLALRRRPHWTHLLAIVGTVAMGLMSQRNIVQFGLLAVPLLALHWGLAWDEIIGRRPFAKRFAFMARTGATTPYVVVTVALLGLLAYGRGRVGSVEVIPDQFNPERFPVAAVAEARSEHLEGRLFHEFTWGGYLLWAWPEQKVFIDGGSDFYGGNLLRAYRHVVNVQPGWRDSLDTWRIDLVLVRSSGAIAGELMREPAWRSWYADSTATIFRRTMAP